MNKLDITPDNHYAVLKDTVITLNNILGVDTQYSVKNCRIELSDSWISISEFTDSSIIAENSTIIIDGFSLGTYASQVKATNSNIIVKGSIPVVIIAEDTFIDLSEATTVRAIVRDCTIDYDQDVPTLIIEERFADNEQPENTTFLEEETMGGYTVQGAVPEEELNTPAPGPETAPETAPEEDPVLPPEQPHQDDIQTYQDTEGNTFHVLSETPLGERLPIVYADEETIEELAKTTTPTTTEEEQEEAFDFDTPITTQNPPAEEQTPRPSMKLPWEK